MENMRQVIIELKQRNYKNFDTFYAATKKQVFFAVITIIKDENLAEDLIQDTYLKFLENIDYVNEQGNVKAYLTKIARNLAINMYNKRKKEIIDNEQFEYMPSNEPIPYDEQAIFQILEILEDEEKEIVVMHVINELKFREIADIVEKPLGTVLWIYNKAIKKLKSKAGEYFE
jgi:RNA polymerase sigma-70 factor, ECF subfamily